MVTNTILFGVEEHENDRTRKLLQIKDILFNTIIWVSL